MASQNEGCFAESPEIAAILLQKLFVYRECLVQPALRSQNVGLHTIEVQSLRLLVDCQVDQPQTCCQVVLSLLAAIGQPMKFGSVEVGVRLLWVDFHRSLVGSQSLLLIPGFEPGISQACFGEGHRRAIRKTLSLSQGVTRNLQDPQSRVVMAGLQE